MTGAEHPSQALKERHEGTFRKVVEDRAEDHLGPQLFQGLKRDMLSHCSKTPFFFSILYLF